MLIKHEAHAGVFNLVVHNSGEAWNGLLNVYLGAAVRLDDVGKASGQCGMPAVDASNRTYTLATVLVSICRFGTYQLR